jgi:hypothetical protein
MSSSPIIWALLAGFAGWIWALGLGRARIRGVRDERDAYWSRLLFGGMAVVCGVVVFLSSSSVAQGISAVLALGGLQMIRSARRLARGDETNVVNLADALDAIGPAARPVAREPIDIHPKLGWTVFVVATGVGTMVLLVFAGLEVWDRLPTIGWGAIGIATFGVILVLIPVFALLWLARVMSRKPFLRIDDWGITQGNDRARDPAISWAEIDRIEGRWVASSGYRDVLLIIHPRDPVSLARRSTRTTRLLLTLSRVMYGAPIAISTTTLGIPREELIARLAAYFPALRRPPGS